MITSIPWFSLLLTTSWMQFWFLMIFPKYINCSILSTDLFHQVFVQRWPVMSPLILCQMTGRKMWSTGGTTDKGQQTYSVNNLPQFHFHNEKMATNRMSHGTAQNCTLGQLFILSSCLTDRFQTNELRPDVTHAYKIQTSLEWTDRTRKINYFLSI